MVKRKIVASATNKKEKVSPYRNYLFRDGVASVEFSAQVRFFTDPKVMSEEEFSKFLELMGIEQTSEQRSGFTVKVPQARPAKGEKKIRTCEVIQDAIDYYNSLGIDKEDKRKKPISAFGSTDLKFDFSKINFLTDDEGCVSYPCGLIYINDSKVQKIGKMKVCVSSNEDLITEINNPDITAISFDEGTATIEGNFKNVGNFIAFFVGEEDKEGRPILSIINFVTSCYHDKDNSNVINNVYLRETSFSEVLVEDGDVLGFLLGDNGPFKYFDCNNDLQFLYDFVYVCGGDPNSYENLVKTFDVGETWKLSEKNGEKEFKGKQTFVSYSTYLNLAKISQVKDTSGGAEVYTIPKDTVQDFQISKTPAEEEEVEEGPVAESENDDVTTQSLTESETDNENTVCQEETGNSEEDYSDDDDDLAEEYDEEGEEEEEDEEKVLVTSDSNDLSGDASEE